MVAVIFLGSYLIIGLVFICGFWFTSEGKHQRLKFPLDTPSKLRPFSMVSAISHGVGNMASEYHLDVKAVGKLKAYQRIYGLNWFVLTSMLVLCPELLCPFELSVGLHHHLEEDIMSSHTTKQDLFVKLGFQGNQ